MWENPEESLKYHTNTVAKQPALSPPTSKNHRGIVFLVILELTQFDSSIHCACSPKICAIIPLRALDFTMEIHSMNWREKAQLDLGGMCRQGLAGGP